MGYRIAEAARDRGAVVTLVSGPTALPAPPGVSFVPVRSADDMAAAVAAHGSAASVVVMAAAVSDYRPARVAAQKIKKTPGDVSLAMVRTPDILRGLGEAKGNRTLVGFAGIARPKGQCASPAQLSTRGSRRAMQPCRPRQLRQQPSD
jgi:phosphopantothenoylcysteine decarboxylase/phosphopantothenate--cysteine ligase